jgi:fructose-1,6-bisphosphatase/inositol monophosphatase family enzyme
MLTGHPQNLEALRVLLCELQNSIRDALIAARSTQAEEFAEIAHVTEADTIYAIDKVSEEAILNWFEAYWPTEQPVEIVMEGIEEKDIVTFPSGVPQEMTLWKCILDPIDGTRGIMYDKRSAWSLAALAPQKGEANRLSDIVVAAMSELPTSKSWRADQISGIKGCGRDGLVCEAINVLSGEKAPLTLQPSSKQDFKHGFASTSRFFPEGKALMSKMEEELWDELYGLGSTTSPLIFDDQYICSGGQIYEVMAGHDRMVGDLRPFAYQKLGFDSSLVCHPYDVCTGFLLKEAGGVIEAPDGSPLDAPLDTISSVCWMGYANETLASQVRPILKRLITQYF